MYDTHGEYYYNLGRKMLYKSFELLLFILLLIQLPIKYVMTTWHSEKQDSRVYFEKVGYEDKAVLVIVLCSFNGNSKGITSALNLSVSRTCCDASSWAEKKNPLVDKGEFDSLNRCSHTVCWSVGSL